MLSPTELINNNKKNVYEVLLLHLSYLSKKNKKKSKTKTRKNIIIINGNNKYKKINLSIIVCWWLFITIFFL